MTEKRREPTILDRINNQLTSDRKVRSALMRYGQSVVPELVEEGYNLAVTRDRLAAKLTDWLYSRSFTGRGTKKLVDKAVARLLKNYERDLRAGLVEEARRLRGEGWAGQRRADAIKADLARGKVGKGRDRWYYR